MNRQDRIDFTADGRSRERRANFDASDRAVREWRARHPVSLSDFVEFLEQMQEMFGTPPRDDFRSGQIRRYRL